MKNPASPWGHTLRKAVAAGILGLCALAPTGTVLAAEASPLSTDPVTEQRLQALSQELRCLVCQNQTIADSNADLAQDLRQEIRGLIRAGKSDGEITDFMVARYGDFVLYRPPFRAATALLWTGPLLLALAGLLALIRNLRQRNRQVTDDAPLSEEDVRRAQALLKEADQP